MKRGFFEVKEIALKYEREEKELPNSKDRYVFNVVTRCFEVWSDVQEWLGRGGKYVSVDLNKAVFWWNLRRLVENRIMEVDI